MTERKRSYYVCDGCGYEIDGDSKYGMLTLIFKPYRKVQAEAKHFHGPRVSETTSAESKVPLIMRDCLDYWWHNRKARELAEGKTW